MRVYTQVDAVLGPKRTLTPEGYLYCEDVPLARTGIQVYHQQELKGIPAGDDGFIHVERPADQVFADKAIASFISKPFTLNHPPANLNPLTFRDYTRGVVMNPRRGTGEHADMMVGDILVCDRETIDAIVIDGVREVSGGYYAEYEVLSPGRARQVDIVGNHVALVPRGRCGGACAIGDHALPDTVAVVPGNPAVATRVVTWKDKVRAAHLVNDQKALDAALSEAADVAPGPTGQDIHFHMPAAAAPAPTSVAAPPAPSDFAKMIGDTVRDSMAPVLARLDALEGKKPAGDTTATAVPVMPAVAASAAVTTVADASPAYTVDQLPNIIQQTVADADLIMPGIRLAKLDPKGDPRQVTDNICAQRRQTLTAAMMMPASQDVITPLLNNQPRLESMTCDMIATIFAATANNIKVKNNHSSTSGKATGDQGPERTFDGMTFRGPVTTAEINARNRHARKSGSK